MLPGMWVGGCVLLQCGVCGGSGPCPDEVLEAHAHPCSCGDEVWWARVPSSSGPDGLIPTAREGSSDSDLGDPTQDLTWLQILGVRKEKDPQVLLEGPGAGGQQGWAVEAWLPTRGPCCPAPGDLMASVWKSL